MLVHPLRDVVDLVVDDQPQVARAGVLPDLIPGVAATHECIPPFLTPGGPLPMYLSYGAVVRELIQVLLAHRTARDLALARCWIKHRRSPGTGLAVVIEEHTGWGGEIAESEMGCRILNRQGTGMELPRALEHREAQD